MLCKNIVMILEKKYSCIVIDDDPIYTEIMERFIDKIDFLELKSSYNNPIEAILAIEKNGTPDILFLDVQMPQIDAFVTIEALDPKPIIIVVSSHWQYEEKLMKQGVNKFISKPIKSVDHLKKEVFSILS